MLKDGLVTWTSGDWGDMQCEDRPAQTVVDSALDSLHGSGDPEVFGVTSAVNGIVKVGCTAWTLGASKLLCSCQLA